MSLKGKLGPTRLKTPKFVPMVAALETGRFRLTEVSDISLADLRLDDLSDTPAVSKAATGG